MKDNSTKIYIDESGNTGQDLLNQDQRVFILSSNNFNDSELNELKAIFNECNELHFVKLKVREEEFDNFDGETEDKKGYLSLFHGVKPEYHIFRTKDEKLSFVAEEINKLLDDGFHYNDIVIAARTRSSVNDFRNHLHL